MSSFTRAVLILLLAILLFDIQGALIKMMGHRYPVTQIATFRNFFGLVPCFVVLMLSEEWRAGRRTLKLLQWRLAFFRGVSIFGAQMFMYSALVRMEFATVGTLAFCGPLFITMLSVPILNNKVGWMRWSAVVIGFIGIVWVMRPGSDVFETVALLPIIAAFFYGLTSVLIKRFDDTAPSATINLYTSFGAMVCAFIAMGVTDGFVAIESTRDWGLFIAMGLIGGFAVLLLIIGYRLTEPSNLAPFEYFGIPISFVIGVMWFNETPFDRLFPGVLLIIAGGLLIVWRERIVNQALSTQAKTAKRYS